MRGLALLLVLAAVVPAAAEPVRLFAVGNKQRLDDAVSYRTFRDKMAALMDATHPGRATLVQAGADDVASHLAPADPTAPARALVVFPEDVGLVAALIGTRGFTARQQTGAVGAIASLLGTYAPQFAHYATRYPTNPLVRTLVLATTDTLYRSVYETFRELAMTHRVYVAACANLPPARRVEQATEPDLVALLRDPDEPERTYAYEATSPYPYNTTFVFGPDGEVLVSDGAGGTRRSPGETGGVILGSANKAYLTPIELPPPGNEGGLALATGAVRDLEVLDTPVGRLGIVISKDAWMVDVNDRLVAKGADIILQPEAFSAWSYVAAPWEPDIFKEGGFANLQKTPRLIANVNASMTGNFFDVTFDGQSAILGRKSKGSAGPPSGANAWVGQNPDTGFLALAPWIIPDPAVTDSSRTLASRRQELAAAGARLLPGSGVPCGGPLVPGACENGYREAVVFADVDVPTGPAPVDPVRATPPRFRPSVRVARNASASVARHAPRVAARGTRVYVVWHEEDGGGMPGVRLAVSRNRGRTFARPLAVSDHAPGTVAELHPAIAVRGNDVFVVWQEFASGRDDDRGRIMLARFDARGRKRGSAVRVDDRDDRGAWLPGVAIVGREPVVVWIDERDPGPEGEPLEHVYLARGLRGGTAFAPAVRVDSGTPDVLALHNDNKWAPTIAAVGTTVHVTWADFRSYNWDVFTARSDDGGATWGPSVRVDDFPDLERVNERPVIGLDRRGPVHVVWTDLRAREPDTNVFHARSDDGATFSAGRQVDDSRVGFDPDVDTPSNQWHPALAVDGRRLFVAWQDNRLGNNDVFFTSSTTGGADFVPAERVDDTGTGASEQTRPHLSITGQGRARRCYVVWEDTRDGASDVYLGRRGCAG